jgi:hypothetical protein
MDLHLLDHTEEEYRRCGEAALAEFNHELKMTPTSQDKSQAEYDSVIGDDASPRIKLTGSLMHIGAMFQGARRRRLCSNHLGQRDVHVVVVGSDRN